MKKIVILTVTMCLMTFFFSCKAEKNYIPVERIELNKTELNLETENEFQLEAKIYPENATNRSVKWVSSDSRTVSVDQNGLLKALVGGKCTIMAKSDDGVYATCEVSSVQGYVPVDEIKVTPTEKTIKVGESFVLEVKVLPLNATNQGVEITIPGRDIIDVTPLGEVIGVGPGTAEILFSIKDETVKSKCVVTVTE